MYAIGRMQKGEYDTPVRIYGRIIVGANRIRPILYLPNIMHLPKINGKINDIP